MQPQTEETGAVRTRELEKRMKEFGSWRCQNKIGFALDDGPAMPRWAPHAGYGQLTGIGIEGPVGVSAIAGGVEAIERASPNSSRERLRRCPGLLRRNLSDLVADLHIPDMVGLCVYFADIGQFYYQNVIASPYQPRIRRPSSIRKESRLLVALFRTNSQQNRV
jgi:hypothetical protein